MDSGKSWTNICSECGRHVEILNGDVEFSMDVHNQSHKTLDTINKDINTSFKHTQEKIDNTTKLNLNYCHDCKENIEVINNDLSLSFQLHAQKHQIQKDNTDSLSDHSSTSSGNSRTEKSKPKEKIQSQPLVTSILDAIFHTMPIGLKAHRGFISEKDCRKAVCNLCEVTIEPIFSVGDHLKTKLHEDNTIQVIKTMLPSELHDQMEFVSFYGSNLCCNLCRCKIDLSSNNLHETLVNIFAHNAGKVHLNSRTNSNDSNQSDKTLVIVKTLALINPVVNENQHLIEHKMHPYFKCKLCDKTIVYSENEKELVNNFTSHFNSSGHNRSLGAMSLLKKWNDLNIPGKENHNLNVCKQSICCLSCSCNIETNLEQLLTHVRKPPNLYGKGQPELVSGIGGTQTTNLPTTNSSSTMKDNFKSKTENPMSKKPLVQPVQSGELSAKFKRLVRSLPGQFQQMITENKKGEAVCTICKCVIPSTTFNLTAHLNGSIHKKNENEAKLNEIKVRSQSAKTVEVPQAASFNMECDLLASTNRFLAANRDVFAKYDGENKYICLLCGTIIQADLSVFQKNILLHIESQGHVYKVQLKGEMSQLLSRHKSELAKELFDFIPLSFQKNMRFIIAPEGVNFVFCTICYLKLPRHSTCLQEHLEGNYHETSVERFGKVNKGPEFTPDGDALFQELLNTNKKIKISSRYLEKKDDDYTCKLCQSVIKNAYDKSLLEGNIMAHINGKKHKKNVEGEFNNTLDVLQRYSSVIKVNRMFLKKNDDRVFCTLCSCQITSADNTGAFKHNLEVHLNGNGHITKRKVMEQATSSSTSVHQPETVTSPYPPQNFVIEAMFEKLPLSFRGDMQFITNSSIENYLSCTLCKSIIDPRLLKEHLETFEHRAKM